MARSFGEHNYYLSTPAAVVASLLCGSTLLPALRLGQKSAEKLLRNPIHQRMVLDRHAFGEKTLHPVAKS